MCGPLQLKFVKFTQLKKWRTATHTATVCNFWGVNIFLGGYIKRFVWQGSGLGRLDNEVT